ncbi:DUF3037 domain-containing protein [Dokdonella sp.]|uniref:DUF3037 domain-containing protein n=1 Tax=Dokdonella sp. TaxID=2291710 RepID=UPI0025C6B7A1|nr:DUF3037 domain-containing protein [Dokdonella sp.]
MHAAYDYALIRVVPRVERGEFVNAGVVLSSKSGDFLEARIELDETRLLALAPDLDLDAVRRHLTAFAAICAGGEDAGPIGRLPRRERFHWLTATRSTMIQTSPVHSGRCGDAATMLERLLDTMVRVPAARGPSA